MESGYGYDYIPNRGLTKATMAKYNIVSKYNEEGDVVAISFPYHNGTGSKVRDLTQPKNKQFSSKGDMAGRNGLFGKEVFPAGSTPAIAITEGEYDAPSVYQMLNKDVSAVSVKSSGQAKKDCAAEFDYLDSFSRIYLCFDNDGVGQSPVEQVASLFDPKKVYHVKLTKHKDANDYLKADDTEEFRKAWYNARPYVPDNIVSSYADIDQIIEEEIPASVARYPWKLLDDALSGIRTGEIILFTALEGIGKTEILRALEYHLLETTDENMGIIHLEETKARSIRGLVGNHLSVPIHLSSCDIPSDEIKRAFRDLTKSDGRLYIYDHFGSTDPERILVGIRYLVSACDCKFIFLDHISMVVSGVEEGDERRKLDYLSTKLAMLVKELDFCLFMVSHVNDDGLTRGSRNISKTAHVHIHLDRNLEASDETERNTTQLTIRKNRPSSITGPSSRLYFNPDTFMVTERIN